VRDPSLVRAGVLKALGASGVMAVGNSVQAVFGPLSENLKTDMDDYLRTSGRGEDTVTPAMPPAGEPWARESAAALLAALGGRANLRRFEAVALTRLRVELADDGRFDEPAARTAGVVAVMRIAPKVLHLIVGDKAAQCALALSVV
jgi:glucose PTS system EIICB or EIICBA component